MDARKIRPISMGLILFGTAIPRRAGKLQPALSNSQPDPPDGAPED
jgi:hypothetical protein